MPSTSSGPSVCGGGYGTPTISSPSASRRRTVSPPMRASAHGRPTLRKNCADRSSMRHSVPDDAEIHHRRRRERLLSYHGGHGGGRQRSPHGGDRRLLEGHDACTVGAS